MKSSVPNIQIKTDDGWQEIKIDVIPLSQTKNNVKDFKHYPNFPDWWDGDETYTAANELGNPYLFARTAYDYYDSGSLGLYYDHTDTYHPALGRLLHRNRVGYLDGMNLYEYAAGNPGLYAAPWEYGPDLDPHVSSDPYVPPGFREAILDFCW